jgi:Flp pilus assembly protein TadG
MYIAKMRLFREQRGSEVLEFAIMLPLLVMLLTGGIEFGRAFYTYNILTKSVRNAARYLSAKDSGISSTGAVDTTTKARTKNLVVYGNIDGSGSKIIPDLTIAQIDVTDPAPAVGSGFFVTVSANYPYSPLFGRVLQVSATFRPKVTMRFVGYVPF